MGLPEVKHERRTWAQRDRSGSVIQHFDMIQTWVRVAGTSVWVLAASMPASEVQS